MPTGRGAHKAGFGKITAVADAFVCMRMNALTFSSNSRNNKHTQTSQYIVKMGPNHSDNNIGGLLRFKIKSNRLMLQSIEKQ